MSIKLNTTVTLTRQVPELEHRKLFQVFIVQVVEIDVQRNNIFAVVMFFKNINAK